MQPGLLSKRRPASRAARVKQLILAQLDPFSESKTHRPGAKNIHEYEKPRQKMGSFLSRKIRLKNRTDFEVPIKNLTGTSKSVLFLSRIFRLRNEPILWSSFQGSPTFCWVEWLHPCRAWSGFSWFLLDSAGNCQASGRRLLD